MKHDIVAEILREFIQKGMEPEPACLKMQMMRIYEIVAFITVAGPYIHCVNGLIVIQKSLKICKQQHSVKKCKSDSD